MTPPSLGYLSCCPSVLAFESEFEMFSPPSVYVEEHECITNAFHNTIKDDIAEGA